MPDPVRKLNPFQPDEPVRPSIFTGRTAERSLICDALVDGLRGRPINVLITGERGMGKTSLTRIVAELAVSPEVTGAAGDVLPPVVLAVSLGFCASVDEMCGAILSEAYKSVRVRKPSVIAWFRDELARLDGLKVGFFGVSVEARPGHSNALRSAFPDALEGVLKQVEDVAGSLVIILDETEHIAKDTRFPSFLKSLVEVLGHKKLNIQFVVTATPEGRDAMTAIHPAFPRLFRHVTVDRLSDAEVAELIERAVKEGWPKKKTTPDFIETVQFQASGLPSFVHEIGRAAFEVDTDDVLDRSDAVNGIMGTDTVVGAITMLEQKHFRERYSKKILSNTYREILHAMASIEGAIPGDEVSIDQIRERLPNVPQLSPYLANMAKRQVLVRVEGKRGVYRLPDRMFGVFLRLSDSKFHRQKEHAAPTSTPSRGSRSS